MSLDHQIPSPSYKFNSVNFDSENYPWKPSGTTLKRLKFIPVDNFGTVVGENPDCLLLCGIVVGENPDHVCWDSFQSEISGVFDHTTCGWSLTPGPSNL